MPVIKCVYIVAVGLLALIQSASSTNMETVWLKDVTTLIQADRRSLSEKDLLNELSFHLRRGSETLTLNLRRNYDINPNADFYFAQRLKDGRFALVKSQDLEREDIAYYQDKEHGAFMTVRCVTKSNKHCDRVINGNIRIGDSTYDLRPAENDIKSRNLLEVPGHLGKQYVLREETLIQRDILAETKDAAHVTEKKVEEELIALLRRFDGKYTENHIPLSDATLSSRNVAALRNRTSADISRRQQKKEYHVKVAVLIDSGLWDFYSSIVPILNPLEKRRKVMKNITESFSHIMNGVNMLYKGIEDPGISINVILADFIVFKGNAFPHKSSNVVSVNGTKLIKVGQYINDAEAWDKAEGVKNARVFDTGILFTRYNLYGKSIDNATTRGYANINGVCKIGERMVIVEARGLFWTVFIAAHELGHNLGAYHDGEKSAKACKADDNFIMSSLLTGTDIMTSSRNPWLFSNCSVKAFKDTLKHKKCVTEPGSFYNDQEYMGYVKHEPGEVYTPDHQCRLIIGRNSRCCETAFITVCHSMRCLNPSTGECMPKLHGAARGTRCGSRMWCIDAKCVPKD